MTKQEIKNIEAGKKFMETFKRTSDVSKSEIAFARKLLNELPALTGKFNSRRLAVHFNTHNIEGANRRKVATKMAAYA